MTIEHTFGHRFNIKPSRRTLTVYHMSASRKVDCDSKPPTNIAMDAGQQFLQRYPVAAMVQLSTQQVEWDLHQYIKAPCHIAIK